ncbi:CPBP family intramembrane glutamic endopeptidase [Furfurilactobacillus entadae]|uniref:CPBP family intramembrane glutamic endopeptidase n=1 Tax=Furfurilactobacillus entadae TaxID=2922307 RepID=UPI0035E98952
MTKRNLNRLWFIIVTIIILTLSFNGPGFVMTPFKGTSMIETSGKVDLPLVNLVLLLIDLGLAKYIWRINFGLSVVKLKTYSKRINTLLWVVPTIIMILASVFYPNHLMAFFKVTLPSQVLVGLFGTLIAAIITGYFEEVVFRGGIFGFLNSLIHSERSILYSSLIAGLFFGVIHLSNLAGGASLAYTLAQMFYAAAYGFFAGMIYVKTQSLLLPVISHALADWFDFFFNISVLGRIDKPFILSLVSIILTIVFIVCGYLIYKTIDEKDKTEFDAKYHTFN